MERGKYKKVPVDIDEVVIDVNSSKDKRIASFVKQVKNPYLMKINGVVVEMEFADSELTMQEAVELAMGIDDM